MLMFKSVEQVQSVASCMSPPVCRTLSAAPPSVCRSPVYRSLPYLSFPESGSLPVKARQGPELVKCGQKRKTEMMSVSKYIHLNK